MFFLAAALTAPVFGPILYAWLHGRPSAVRLVDGFVYIAVPSLVAWQILPHAWNDRTLVPLAALGLGILVPTLFERASHALETHTDNLAIVVGISGLVVHALLEGAALAPAAGSIAVPFALAVVLHRVPVGLVIWWLLRPRHGRGIATSGVAAVVLATLAGYAVGANLPLGDHTFGVEVYQAFVSGSLMHVVFHQGRRDHQHEHPQGHDHEHEHEHEHDHNQ
ncbi:MAG: hypothetical protein O2992_07250 [Gemmatimonadetes bacterium]|nr:hypothetical protein [Gemmatimonadota bacterium]